MKISISVADPHTNVTVTDTNGDTHILNCTDTGVIFLNIEPGEQISIAAPAPAAPVTE